jgi:hypothetical protein
MATDFDAQMAAAAERAVDVARARGGAKLDYTEASLETVEAILNEISQVSLSAEQLRLLSQDFGSYVLEVARRLHGGEYQWLTDRNEPVLVWGQPTYRVAMIGWGKVLGRLSGDLGDNIPFFYAGFAGHIKNPTAGKQVTYV